MSPGMFDIPTKSVQDPRTALSNLDRERLVQDPVRKSLPTDTDRVPPLDVLRALLAFALFGFASACSLQGAVLSVFGKTPTEFRTVPSAVPGMQEDISNLLLVVFFPGGPFLRHLAAVVGTSGALFSPSFLMG